MSRLTRKAPPIPEEQEPDPDVCTIRHFIKDPVSDTVDRERTRNSQGPHRHEPDGSATPEPEIRDEARHGEYVRPARQQADRQADAELRGPDQGRPEGEA